MSFAIQLATVPLTAYFFYEVPVWSMLINFLCCRSLEYCCFLDFLAALLGYCLSVWQGFFLCLVTGFWYFMRRCAGSVSVYRGLSGSRGSRIGRNCCFLSDIGSRAFRNEKDEATAWICFHRLFMLLAVLHNPVKGFELDVLDVGRGTVCIFTRKRGQISFLTAAVRM